MNDVLKFISHLAHDTSPFNQPRTQFTHNYGQCPVNPRAQLPPGIYIENLGNERAAGGRRPPVTRGHSPSSSQDSCPPSPSVISDDRSFNSATAHNRNGGFPCFTCGRKFTRKSRLENCRNMHEGIKPYKCSGACGGPEW
jgi:hypothetical protein